MFRTLGLMKFYLDHGLDSPGAGYWSYAKLSQLSIESGKLHHSKK